MARRSQRNRRPAAQRGPGQPLAGSQQQSAQQRPASQRPSAPPNSRQNGASANGDRYEKYLPAWMKGANGAPPPRPRGPRRARPQRPAGGYTPGKFAANPDLLS